ncbi:dTDP-4-amino-4,6-dideoxygalactose transaminase [Granulicatella balaenopterae]|uniref:dTDP-4-amino-4,6-dideoxygalactose transaminase n=1 Tax=Granulicatella balaenopterae TaxID=137733 RepID=A0A1H9NFM7_9LACT|nr:DegT/DnrJ/EryC1/StrS family aminotransferase [Granulicatella balaenopterae]SER34469.1 dTDP-4-amino-4,6-dideoxygalactose transaminase [Granulicatella balaenopterae]
MNKIPFSPPDITEKEIEAVSEALRSGWITTGPKTKEFERQLAEYLDVSRVVCLNSATAALELGLRVLGVGPGDEVIVPAYTYTASCSVIEHVGATPVLVDIQKNHFEMDYTKLQEAITEKTKVIIPVEIAGVPCDYETIYAAVEAKKDLFKASTDLQKAFNRIVVISDSAHAMGTVKNGQSTAKIADFASYSFHAVKNLTTAEGGCIAWDTIPGVSDDEIYKQFQIFSLHGQTKDALAKMKPGSWEYDIIIPGYKCNMTDIMAAIGLVQLERYPDLLARRRQIVRRVVEGLQDVPVRILSHEASDYQSSRHLLITHIEGASLEQRAEIIEKMAEAGIACNVHYKPLPLLTAYHHMGFEIKDYPNAYHYYQNEVTLPLHTLLSDDDVERIIATYKQVISDVMSR